MGDTMKAEGDLLHEVEREMLKELKLVLNEPQAHALVDRVLFQIRQKWGGTQPYIRDSRQMRNRRIIREWTNQRKEGYSNLGVIAKAHHVSVQTVNRIISAHLKELRHPKQGFGNDTWNL